jgi:hypothetical protein
MTKIITCEGRSQQETQGKATYLHVFSCAMKPTHEAARHATGNVLGDRKAAK